MIELKGWKCIKNDVRSYENKYIEVEGKVDEELRSALGSMNSAAAGPGRLVQNTSEIAEILQDDKVLLDLGFVSIPQQDFLALDLAEKFGGTIGAGFAAHEKEFFETDYTLVILGVSGQTVQLRKALNHTEDCSRAVFNTRAGRIEQFFDLDETSKGSKVLEVYSNGVRMVEDDDKGNQEKVKPPTPEETLRFTQPKNRIRAREKTEVLI